MNVAVEAIDIHPRIGTPESVYGDEACSLFLTLTSRHAVCFRTFCGVSLFAQVCILKNKFINCFQFSPVPFQRKPLEGLQVQSPETSLRKRSAPIYDNFLSLLAPHEE